MEKTILGYDNYKITDNGEVISTKWNKKRKLKPQKASQSKKKYLQVRLFKDDVGRRNKKDNRKMGTLHYVHRLVYEHFVGDIPSDLTIDHIDGDPQNNSVSNLQLLPARHNVEKYHRVKRGRLLRDFRDEMIEEYKIQKSYKKVAEVFDCSITSVQRIVKDKVCMYDSKEKKWKTKRHSNIDDEFTNLKLKKLREIL